MSKPNPSKAYPKSKAKSSSSPKPAKQHRPRKPLTLDAKTIHLVRLALNADLIRAVHTGGPVACRRRAARWFEQQVKAQQIA